MKNGKEPKSRPKPKMICPIYENCGPNLSLPPSLPVKVAAAFPPFVLHSSPAAAFPLSSSLSPASFNPRTAATTPYRPKAASGNSCARPQWRTTTNTFLPPANSDRDAHPVRWFRLADSLEQLWVTPPRSSGFFSSLFSSSRSFGTYPSCFGISFELPTSLTASNM